jgi:hypothetical protein
MTEIDIIVDGDKPKWLDNFNRKDRSVIALCWHKYEGTGDEADVTIKGFTATRLIGTLAAMLTKQERLPRTYTEVAYTAGSLRWRPVSEPPDDMWMRPCLYEAIPGRLSRCDARYRDRSWWAYGKNGDWEVPNVRWWMEIYPYPNGEVEDEAQGDE